MRAAIRHGGYLPERDATQAIQDGSIHPLIPGGESKPWVRAVLKVEYVDVSTATPGLAAAEARAQLDMVHPCVARVHGLAIGSPDVGIVMPMYPRGSL